jgi:membrane fusion protein, peptide pheromone/bacteriocin exporter
MEDYNFLDYSQSKNDQYFYIQKLSISSNVLYNILLLFVIAIIVVLPFVDVDITSSAYANVLSSRLKENVYSPTVGKITKLMIEDNQPVMMGDTIMEIDNSYNQNELEIIYQKKETLRENIRDIGLIQNSSSLTNSLPLHTAQYQSQYLNYLEQKGQLTTKFENANLAYQRYLKLYHDKVIPSEEFEKYELAYNQSQQDIELLTTRFKSQIQTEGYQYKQEWVNLNVKVNQLKENIKNSYIIANITGITYKMEGIQMGTFLQSGQKVAEINPNTGLIISCMVSPKDIGFIKEKQKVQVQIDSYNYYDWGMLNGSVYEIVKEVTMIQNSPYYTVYCKMDKPFLSMKNGYQGKIIKGMTGRANFVLTKRTLWQLLFSKAGDWLNPKSK